MQSKLDPALLVDNADKREEFQFFKVYTEDDLNLFKTELSNVALEINDIEQDKKIAMAQYKDELKLPKEKFNNLLSNIKDKGELVEEDCYVFIDIDDNEVGYYDSEGKLVHTRQCKPEEKQRRINLTSKTGTND